MPLVPGLAAVALMIFWAVDNGGYDPATWYWGALVLLGVLSGVTLLTPSGSWRRLPRSTLVALGAFALYVAWSYLSITWAQSPGDALQGSNRALLYLLLFALLAVLPWTPEAALTALVTFAFGIGVIALVMLLRLGTATNLQNLILHGRFLAPTGYFNSTVSLFMMGALVAVALASRRRLPGLLRGGLMAVATADLQLAVLGQSRGWLFTLPFVLIAAALWVRRRVRVVVAALLPIAATLISLNQLLAVYRTGPGLAALDHAARSAGRISLLMCAAVLVAGTLGAWADMLSRPRRLSKRSRGVLGAAVAALAVGAGIAGAIGATHGDPAGFIKRQWQGFTHPPANGTKITQSGSYFGVAGSGRYDFWRVSLDAVKTHPLGGLGQDNFADYYVTRRRTIEEPQWTHSLEMRLLAHTGIVGFVLFAGFMGAAVAAALTARRRGKERWIVGVAVLPLVEWLIHGSIDWFWEMPALSGPALGFLAVAGALGPPRSGSPLAWRPLKRPVAVGLGLAAVITATVVLGLPYLAANETASALSIRERNSAQALRDLKTAADLNPLSAVPGRLGGALALQTGRLNEAEQRFDQAIDREPGGWFSWLGAGLAASALGDVTTARHDFRVAASLNSRQPAIAAALDRVGTTHPLTPAQAFNMLVLSQ